MLLSIKCHVVPLNIRQKWCRNYPDAFSAEIKKCQLLTINNIRNFHKTSHAFPIKKKQDA